MTTPAGEGFPKAARVRRRREYLALGRAARRRHTPHFVVLSATGGAASRLGITVSRKVGGAVVRNRVKRCVRELFRRDQLGLVAALDVVVIAKPGAGDLSQRQIAAELTEAITPSDDRARRV